MMNRFLSLLLFLLFLVPISAIADGFSREMRKGNEAYQSGDYVKALEHYHLAEAEKPEAPELRYNLAGAAFRQGKFESAIEDYSRALNTDDVTLEANAHYNLGNTHYRAGDYQKAIQSYERALELNPTDVDSKFNLEMARKMLKEHSKPDEQNKEEKKDEQQKDQKKDQQQDQQDQQNQNEEQQDQQQEQDEDKQGEQEQNEKQDGKDDKKDEQEQKQQEPQKAKQMSKEDAERILNSLKDDEHDIQKKIKRQTVVGNYRGKDW